MSPKTAEPVTSFVSAVAREERSAAGSSMSLSGRTAVPRAVNEPVRAYAPGSPERAELKARLASMSTERVDIPIVVDGERIRTGQTNYAVMPHDHKHILGDWHKADRTHVEHAIDAALRAQREWARWPFEDRATVFLKAAELLSTT